MDAGEGTNAKRDVALRDVDKPFIYIFCEDAYGKLFFEVLAKRIRGASSWIKVRSFKGPFDSKAERAVASAAYSAHKIILVLDGHGEQNLEYAINNRLKHVDLHKSKLSVVVCENSIEDWLVASECVELK